MKAIFKQIIPKIIFLVGISMIVSCQPEEAKSNGLAISADELNPTFIIDQSNAAQNRFTLTGKTDNILGNIWDLGDGNNPTIGGNSLTAFIPDAGTYVIEHKVVGRGGASKTESQTLIVPTSDLAAGNLVQGGKFLNATDHAKWTILNIAGSHINWTFGNGFANVSGSSPNQYAQRGIFQSMQVIGGKKYKLDMKVSGSPCLSSWFEVFVSKKQPVQNSDFGDALDALTNPTGVGIRLGIKTFDNCLMANAFSGKLSDLKCTGKGAIVEFATSGTVYLVIKSGGFDNNSLGSGGIRVTNVELRGVQ